MNVNLHQKDILFSEVLVGQNLQSPVIVVGLPRSGSSYLAHLLSCTQDWFVFDDLYPYQRAARHGLIGINNLSDRKDLIKKYLVSLGWSLRSKIRFEKNFSSQTFADLTPDDVDKMEASVFHSIQDQPNLSWAKILDEWMTRLALYSGKSRWGYKTPKDYLNLQELNNVFPKMKIIFLFRNPLKVMQSYKSLPREQKGTGGDGISRQYHSLVYALYWRDAYLKTTTFKSINFPESNLLKIKFEEMIDKNGTVLQELSNFLDSPITSDVEIQSTNSSMTQGSKRELTGLEKSICLLVNGNIMTDEGYKSGNNTIRISDFLELAWNSIDFIAYQIESVLIRPSLRLNAIQSFLKSISRGQGKSNTN